MKIITRLTHGFIELRVDEIETTIYKSSKIEIMETIQNLLYVIDEIESLEKQRDLINTDELNKIKSIT